MENNKNKLDGPDFLVIGAPKAGTTWIYERFCIEHTQVYRTWVKEISYFFEVNKNIDMSLFGKLFKKKHRRQFWWREVLSARLKKFKWYFLEKDRFLWQLKFFFYPRSDKWYKSLFNVDSNKIAGDLTPSYSTFESKEVKRVYEVCPKAKIIYVMRNPIERDWSHAMMSLGRNNNKNFEEIDKVLLEKVLTSYSRESDYLKTIKNWKNFYEGNILFLYYDELKNAPELFYNKICDFLEIENQIGNAKISSYSNQNSKNKSIPKAYYDLLVNKHKKSIEKLATVLGNEYNEIPLSWINNEKE